VNISGVGILGVEDGVGDVDAMCVETEGEGDDNEEDEEDAEDEDEVDCEP
jgi:hypothetical protein